MAPVLTQATTDFFTKPMLLRTLLPFFGGFLIMTFLVMGLFDIAFSTAMPIDGEQSSFQQTMADWKATLDNIPLIGSALVWLFEAIGSVLLIVIGFFIVMYGSLFVAMFLTGFLTAGIVGFVGRKHYPDVALESFGSVLTAVMFPIKVLIKFFLMFLVFIPLLFVPLLNVAVLSFLFYYLFRQFLLFDVGSSLLNETDFKRYVRFRNMGLLSLSGILYVLSLLPIINVLVPVFNVLVVSHHFFRCKQADAAA